MEDLEKQSLSRSVFYGLMTWILIAVAIAISIYGPLWAYPFMIFFIGSRQLALGSLAHEGLHGNLAADSRVNDFWARYFCAFPLFISLSRYRQMHLMHHRFLGTKSDPDLQLFDFYPQRPASLLQTFIVPWITGRTALIYAAYFSDLPGFMKMKFKSGFKSNPQVQDDRGRLILFWFVVLSVFIYTQTFLLFALFWLIPLSLQMVLFRFAGGLQHGVVIHQTHPSPQSRNIAGNRWLIELLLPCAINYHAEHHDNPRVPFFKLKKAFMSQGKSAPGYWETVQVLTSQKVSPP